ncbi:MAG TPA: hypothetical protein EYG11_08880 [Candidatus Latescibacteria bacterium]|nr:hypothetical protein [Candidatus Handelsmanbacteria bacterium]HIL08800.1 hypothetical protein [Candidatus Latescibacterota bacterium]
MQTWVVGTVDEFALGKAQGIQVHPDSLAILARLAEDENVALGHLVIDDFDKPVPLTDGTIDLVRGEWISGTNNVFDKQFTVDLGLDRAIKRVRVLAGETALNQPEYFVRGYRLEAAAQVSPQVWHILAEQPDNFALNVDTNADSTWTLTDSGTALSREGRFVRLTLIREDRSNWVAIGEIEVFGEGYVDEGSLEHEFVPSVPVNVGQVRWQSERPSRTRAELQLRGGAETPWGELAAYTAAEFLFAGDEPVTRLESRIHLANTAPFASPSVARIEIDYDPVLVADQLLAEVVASDSLRKGETSTLVYRINIEADAADHGVSLLQLDGPFLSVEAVRVDGRELAPAQDYDWALTSDRESMLIELAAGEQINTSAMVEIEGQALFVRDKTAVVFKAGNKLQGDRDGYVNWQQGRELPGSTWTVLASGTPLRLLGRVIVEPRPFSPFVDGSARFDFVIGNIEEGKEVILEIFSLDGRRVQQLSQIGSARAYRFDWDGRDRDGQIVAPGLYLYEVRVENSGNARRGTFVVAY